MKNFIFILILTSTLFNSFGQSKTETIVGIQELEKQNKAQQLNVPVYKLYRTENIWTKIRLNTRNGIMSQVHYTISDGYQGILSLNLKKLVPEDEEVNGRFRLIPTENMYNFMLLDQVNGNTWQVQWHHESTNRFISEIY